MLLLVGAQQSRSFYFPAVGVFAALYTAVGVDAAVYTAVGVEAV